MAMEMDGASHDNASPDAVLLEPPPVSIQPSPDDGGTQQFLDAVLESLIYYRDQMPSPVAPRRRTAEPEVNVMFAMWPADDGSTLQWTPQDGVTGLSDAEDDIGVDDAYAGGGFGAVPASGEAIAALPETAVDDDGGTGEDEGCAVCQQEYQAGDILRRMPCSHDFHAGCIAEWLRVSRLCPICRCALPAAADSDSDSDTSGGAEDSDTDTEEDSDSDTERDD